MLEKDEGFKYDDEKGLFTFYKEQDTFAIKRSTSRKWGIDDQRARVDLLNFYSQNNNSSQNVPKQKVHNSEYTCNIDNSSPHSVFLNGNIHPANQIFKQKPTRSKVPNLNLSLSSKKNVVPAIKNIIDLTFKDLTTRIQSHQQVTYTFKNRTRTEASQVEFNDSLDKDHSKRQNKAYSKIQNTLGYRDDSISPQIADHSPKVSSILLKSKQHTDPLKLESTKKLNRQLHLITQPQELTHVPQKIPSSNDEKCKEEFLPHIKRESGESLSFWEYFQNRKIFFMNRYKKAKTLKNSTPSNNELDKSAHINKLGKNKPKVCKYFLNNNI